MSLLTLSIWVIVNWGASGTEPPAVLGLGTLFLMIAAFVVVGVAILRAGLYSTRIGLLLIAEGVALLMVLILPMVLYGGEVPSTFNAGIEGLQAIILLMTGYLLEREGTGTAQREPDVDWAGG